MNTIHSRTSQVMISMPSAVVEPGENYSIDWDAQRAVREQRVAIQAALVERRIEVILNRQAERELQIAALQMAPCALSHTHKDNLAGARQLAERITAPDDAAARHH